MTNGELYGYIREALPVELMARVTDWRPASDMYIEDIAFTYPDGHVGINNGIVMWLDNGDAIIYSKK